MTSLPMSDWSDFSTTANVRKSARHSPPSKCAFKFLRYRIALSSGEISVLSARFLAYLERLHHASAPALRTALVAQELKAHSSDGGWPLHIDATGEDGRGTLGARI